MSRLFSAPHFQKLLPWLLISLFLFWHVAGSPVALANFSPLLAICFTAAWLMPRSYLVGLPLLLIVLSDIARSPATFSQELSWLWPSYLVYVGVIFMSLTAKRNEVKVGGTFALLLGCSIAFYLVTNSASWVMDPYYSKTFSGWWQCLTVGQPGYPPTWQFFRNQLAGDMIFSLALLTAAGYFPAKAAATVPQATAVS
jgi:hypothetical protein